MKKGRLIPVVALIYSLLMAMIPTQAALAATTVTVDDDGSADFTSIQAAINAAASGDTITVMPGTYNEWLTISKPLTLQGSDKNNTILQASSISAMNGIDINATQDVYISGFTITGYRSGISLRDTNNAQISDNIFQNNTGNLLTDYNGVEFVSGVTKSTITDCVFTGNEYGIILRNGSDGNIINGNTLTGNEQVGIYLNSSNENQIINNSAEDNKNGIYLAYNANDNVIENNILSNNDVHGVYVYRSSYNSVLNNTIENNLYNGVFLYEMSSNNTVADNEITGNQLKGIFINTDSDNNTIAGNIISGNLQEGISLFGTYGIIDNTDIYHNTIEGNSKGISIYSAVDARIYNNSFIGNIYYYQAEVQQSSGVVLSLPEPLGGNYWSNWNSPDADSDGFVDNPYSVPFATTDHLPWATPNGWLTIANNPPVAANDSYSTSEDTVINVPAPGLLGNDTDPEGDPLTAVKVTDPVHGTLTLNTDGSFSYTPEASYFGNDSFTYKANDGTADSNVATITISIAPVTIQVTIDIRPGSDVNSINLGSKGMLPVAVLTTAEFDASFIDPVTVEFAGTAPVRWTFEDVDGDGDIDLLFHFNTEDLNLKETSEDAILTGQTSDGHEITGRESIRIVPLKGKK